MASQTFAPSSNNRLVGRGKAFIARHDDDGVRTAYFYVGNCPEFTITPEVTSVENLSSMHSDSRVLDEINVSSKATLALQCQEFNQKNLALALMGEEAFYTQAAVTAVAQTVVLDTDGGLVLGGVYRITKRNATVMALADETAVTALVEGTDWEWINQNAGVFQILADSPNATAGDTLTATVTAPAILTGVVPQMKAGTQTNIKASFMFIGDPAYGPDTEVYVHKCSIKSSAALALIQAQQIGTFQLTATVLDDSAGEYGGTASDPLYHLIQP